MRVIKTKNQKKFDTLVQQVKDDEFNDMLLLIKDAVDEAALRQGIEDMLRKKGPGRPPNHPADLEKAVLMQQYFCVSNRVSGKLKAENYPRYTLNET